ncbi:coiled-coil domain-containing protein 130 [Cryptococcus wingfieldii CBS 7118]|uniref:Coiled-coil domain-containing protein 130 n=1 Tax=Cryptococcus wingfieldii CBS 7118 TaxID=1295528 RepID=A0A1E3JIM6_9TREE|nr:coiled-coil domain-containing protein 130 [Cryptococcus wingfieldii CBS 7118]ODO00673.1 coiled-coil domain-containing protein 130 [Cryptococcus wingfieldii CBS 7118]
MQGFNRYIPPDYDPKANSTLNSHQGKAHALGKRAKDIDKGILVVRFELPYNIWCGSCNAHIGAGVRYNAQKRKVGNYYSTPIYAFRCKCHLCQGWFEIRTDPQNSAYVVHEGAQRKNEDWNPEENGGFKVFDTEAPLASEGPTDPIAHLEKTIDQQEWAKKGTSRLTELTRQSARLNADPYAVSVALRKKFRSEKKLMLEKQDRDDDVKERYGLGEDVDLGEEQVEGGQEEWKAALVDKGRDLIRSGGSVASLRGSERRLGVPKRKARASDPLPDLAATLRRSTSKKYDPFDTHNQSRASPSSASLSRSSSLKGKPGDRVLPKVRRSLGNVAPSKESSIGGGLLSGYGSD